MVEFFTESKDEAVVIEEARAILSEILKEADSSKQKKLLRILLDGFKTCYTQFRRNFRIRGDRGGAEPRDCVSYLGYVIDYLEEANKRNLNLEEKFQRIGMAFGYFLAIVEFGVCSPNFRTYTGNPKSSYQINQLVMTEKEYYRREILQKCEKIRHLLKALKLKIDRGIIESRIKRIAKKRAAKLSPEQQQLLIDMALIVAS